jgi:hypothetical protein
METPGHRGSGETKLVRAIGLFNARSLGIYADHGVAKYYRHDRPA